MRHKLKKVYYCDFCKKHGLMAHWIKQHEKYCTANPKRECRMCGNNDGIEKEHTDFIKKHFKILMSWKGKDGCTDGGILGTHLGEFENKVKELVKLIECPACILAVLRHNIEWLHHSHYSYKEEVDKWWAKKREEAEEEEVRSLTY